MGAGSCNTQPVVGWIFRRTLSVPAAVHVLRWQLSVKDCFIRGSVVRYVHIPASEVDTVLLQDAARKESAPAGSAAAAPATAAAST